ncbi:MAG: response regulator [Beijerinckiaceae bacterium]
MQIGVESSRAVENKRIFVVDEDEIYRAAVQFMLHDENETHEVASLEDAFAKAKTAKPDLVVLASPIVQARGVGVVGEIAAKIPSAKILVIAESVTDEAAKAALRAGANGVVAKPLTIEAVRDKVDQLLGRKAAFAVQFTVLS